MAKNMRRKALGLCAVLAAMAVLCLAFATTALAAATEVTLPDKFNVSDAVTNFKMAKLDSSSHAYVKGAQMVIINKDTQEVVASWTTGEEPYVDKPYELTKTLNVNTHYILREISAPNGYTIAKDTEFYVNASETEGITIVSGDDAELTSSYTVALYDAPATTDQEIVVSGGDTANKQVAPKTGDETPLWLVGVCAAGLLVAAGVLQLVKRSRKKHQG